MRQVDQVEVFECGGAIRWMIEFAKRTLRQDLITDVLPNFPDQHFLWIEPHVVIDRIRPCKQACATTLRDVPQRRHTCGMCAQRQPCILSNDDAAKASVERRRDDGLRRPQTQSKKPTVDDQPAIVGFQRLLVQLPHQSGVPFVRSICIVHRQARKARHHFVLSSVRVPACNCANTSNRT